VPQRWNTLCPLQAPVCYFASFFCAKFYPGQIVEELAKSIKFILKTSHASPEANKILEESGLQKRTIKSLASQSAQSLKYTAKSKSGSSSGRNSGYSSGVETEEENGGKSPTTGRARGSKKKSNDYLVDDELVSDTDTPPVRRGLRRSSTQNKSDRPEMEILSLSPITTKTPRNSKRKSKSMSQTFSSSSAPNPNYLSDYLSPTTEEGEESGPTLTSASNPPSDTLSPRSRRNSKIASLFRTKTEKPNTPQSPVLDERVDVDEEAWQVEWTNSDDILKENGVIGISKNSSIMVILTVGRDNIRYKKKAKICSFL
jgi:hypothetical protein